MLIDYTERKRDNKINVLIDEVQNYITTINVFLGTSIILKVNPLTFEAVYIDQEGKEQLFNLAHERDIRYFKRLHEDLYVWSQNLEIEDCVKIEMNKQTREILDKLEYAYKNTISAEELYKLLDIEEGNNNGN